MTVTETTTAIEVTGGLYSGTVTSATSTVLTVTGAGFTSNAVGRLVWIRTGTGAQQTRLITAQTSTTLTVDVAFSPVPNNTSAFIVSHSTADITASAAVVKNNNNILITKDLDIGGAADTPSFFADNSKNIIVDKGSNTMFYVRRASCFQLGLIDQFDNTYSGCTFRLLNCNGDIIWIDASLGTAQSSDSGDVYFYRCLISCQPSSGNGFWRLYRGADQIARIMDCTFDMWRGARIQGFASILRNIYITNQTGTVGSITTKGAFQENIKNIQVVKSNFAFYYYPQLSGTFTVENVQAYKTNGIRILVDPNLNESMTFLNCLFDNWTFTWNTYSGDPLNTVSTTVTVYRAFRYNIKVLLGSAGTDARCSIYDKNNVEVTNVLSNASTGSITEQVLEYGRYSNTVLTLTTRTPYLARVRRYGSKYEEYSLADTDASATVSDTVRLITNTSIIKTSANAALVTEVAINFISNTITFSGVSVQDAYDYVQYQLSLSTNMKYAEDFTTDGSGNYFLSYWTPIFNGANALTGTGKIISAGTAHYVNGGGTALIVQDITGTRVPIVISGAITNASIRVFRSPIATYPTPLLSGLADGTGKLSGNFLYTGSDIQVIVIARLFGYLPFNDTNQVNATITSTGLSVTVSMQSDSYIVS